jgi:hypothetical protein
MLDYRRRRMVFGGFILFLLFVALMKTDIRCTTTLLFSTPFLLTVRGRSIVIIRKMLLYVRER